MSMIECGNQLCVLRTRKFGADYCQRQVEAVSQLAIGGQDLNDPTQPGPIWPRSRAERYITESKNLASQENCSNPTISQHLDQILVQKEQRGEIV